MAPPPPRTLHTSPFHPPYHEPGKAAKSPEQLLVKSNLPCPKVVKNGNNLLFPFHQFCAICTYHNGTTDGAGFTFQRQGKSRVDNQSMAPSYRTIQLKISRH